MGTNFGLLGARRFAPLFWAQLLGAVNDNLFKNAIVILVLFEGSRRAWLVPLAGGLFILPYALFSAVAGELADKLPKSRLIVATKAYEVGLMVAAGAALLVGNEWGLLAVLFGLGVQATFFGPLKYGVLPELLGEDELMAGNGLVEASTFIGILIGTIAGGLLVLAPHGRGWAAATLLVVALGGFAAARAVPATPAAAPALRVAPGVIAPTRALIGEARRNRTLWRAMLAISWFWALGAAFLAELPVIVQRDLHGGGRMANLMLAMFSVGIGIGAMLAPLLLRGRVSNRLLLPSAAILSLFALHFAWAASWPQPSLWLLLADLLAIAVCGGVYSVPLYALLQTVAEPAARARAVAANNVLNALAIVVGAVVLAAGSAAGASASVLIAGFAVVNVVVGVVLR